MIRIPTISCHGNVFHSKSFIDFYFDTKKLNLMKKQNMVPKLEVRNSILEVLYEL